MKKLTLIYIMVGVLIIISCDNFNLPNGSDKTKSYDGLCKELGDCKSTGWNLNFKPGESYILGAQSVNGKDCKIFIELSETPPD